MAKKLNVLSPDGFAIDPSKTYPSEAKAREAITEWKKRFEHQGYYSSMRGRIPLDELDSYCKIIPAGKEIEEGVKMM